MCSDPLAELFTVIKTRQQQPQEDSYTCKLLAKGENTILKKLGEEIVELVMACKDRDRDTIAQETVDVLYHILVALAYYEVDLTAVYQVMASRRK
ncbi:MAG: phosphoribosyl-ATP diphosphatase [Pseudanabaenaceae cyanobacterium]